MRSSQEPGEPAPRDQGSELWHHHHQDGRLDTPAYRSLQGEARGTEEAGKQLVLPGGSGLHLGVQPAAIIVVPVCSASAVATAAAAAAATAATASTTAAATAAAAGTSAGDGKEQGRRCGARL